MKLPVPPEKKITPKRIIHPPFPEGHSHACLNCGRELSGNYCSNCGQPTNTHRLSVAHFVMHDLVHSFWHVDRGIFFTLKEVVARPGYTAIEFISGRRAGRFPILTLLLLLLGALTWANSFGPHHDTVSIVNPGKNIALVNKIRDFVGHHFKWILLSILPVISLSTLVVFRRTKLNYTEHLLVNSYVFGGYLAVLLLLKTIALAIPATAHLIDGYKDNLVLLSYIFGYWQAYHGAYGIPGITWRMAALLVMDVVLVLLALCIAAILVVAFNMVSNPDLLHQMKQ